MATLAYRTRRASTASSTERMRVIWDGGERFMLCPPGRLKPPSFARDGGLPHSRWSKSGQTERGLAPPTRDGYGQAIAVLDDHGSAGHPLALHRTGVAIATRCNDAPFDIVAAGLGGTLRRQREGCGGKF